RGRGHSQLRPLDRFQGVFLQSRRGFPCCPQCRDELRFLLGIGIDELFRVVRQFRVGGASLPGHEHHLLPPLMLGELVCVIPVSNLCDPVGALVQDVHCRCGVIGHLMRDVSGWKSRKPSGLSWATSSPWRSVIPLSTLDFPAAACPPNKIRVGCSPGATGLMPSKTRSLMQSSKMSKAFSGGPHRGLPTSQASLISASTPWRRWISAIISSRPMSRSFLTSHTCRIFAFASSLASGVVAACAARMFTPTRRLAVPA